jgi:hemoglobin-like flavoprotein
MSEINQMEEVWDLLAGRRRQFIESFYSNLFDQFPDYKQYFPENMDAQMERMMELISAVVRVSHRIPLIRSYLMQVGAAHKDIVKLKKEDLYNFSDVFIITAASTCGDSWEDRHEKAFRAAFDDTIIPIIYDGLNS